MRSKKRWTLAAAATICLVALPAAAQTPGGKTKTKDTAASGSKTKTKAAAGGKTKTKTKTKTTAAGSKTKTAPGGKTKTAPGGKTRAAPGSKTKAVAGSTSKAPADTAKAPAEDPTDGAAAAPAGGPAAAPALTRGQALAKHLDRVARIDRIDALAKGDGNPALSRKMSVLRAKERARHAKVMATLMSKTIKKADDAARKAADAAKGAE